MKTTFSKTTGAMVLTAVTLSTCITIFLGGRAVAQSGSTPIPVPESSDEIVTAPVLPSLAAMNQIPIQVGTFTARVAQVSLIVNQNYPPGQPTLYVAEQSLRSWAEFVSNDPRRHSNSYNGLEWTFDMRHSSASTLVNGVPGVLTSEQAVGMTSLAVNTWPSIPCYSADFGELPYPIGPNFENIELFDDYYLGPEPQPFRPVAEITVAGFYPVTLFRAIYGSVGDDILGFNVTYVFYDGGHPTDIDNNGKPDAFWTETYFNDLWYWGDATAPGVDPNQVYDLQATALHESGHAFGLGHFGRLFENHGGITVAPINAMSHVYQGPFRSVRGTPTGAFCGIFGSWQ